MHFCDLFARLPDLSVQEFCSYLIGFPRLCDHIAEERCRILWEELDDYRPITLSNIELKILAWISVNYLQIVAGDPIRTEQNFAVLGYLMHAPPYGHVWHKAFFGWDRAQGCSPHAPGVCQKCPRPRRHSPC